MRQDIILLLSGLTFSIAICGLTRLTSPLLADRPHPPDKGPLWYYWVLPTTTLQAKTTVWALYLTHQLFNWTILYYIQSNKMSYSTVLRPVQYCLSFGNAVFVLLHWAQTQLSYDGLAQDCHLLLPQVALGGLFAWCLLMESGRRGLAFGHIRPFSKGLLEFARKYHSYYFSFAILFNFWYHPMEGTVQHISGFLYQFLIMVQSVLVLTPIHRHATWTVLLEAGATLHATIVSTIAYPRVWRMFCFGFSFKFFVTEVHGLGQGRGIRAFLTLCYVITYLLVYRQYEYTNMTEILRIPVIHYTSTLLLSIILHWVMWIHNIQ